MSNLIGVIGVGHLGRHHARIAALSSATLVGVFDLDQDRAREVASRWHVTAFETMEELLGAVNAVVVATPAGTHHAIAADALGAGCHCLVEKPLAADSNDGRALVTIARDRNLVLAVGHSERFNPAVERADALVARPLYLECTRLASFQGRGSDIDVVKDLMVHDLEIILNWVGEYPVDVRAVGVSVMTREVDIANARLEFPGGAVATLTASRVSLTPIRAVRVFQRGGYLSVDLKEKRIRMIRHSTAGLDVSEEIAEGPEPLKAEQDDFLAAIRTGNPPRISGEHGVRALRLAEEIVEDIHGRLERLGPE